MAQPLVTVFGGTGFLGRRVVRHLRDHAFEVRVASRRPDRGRRLFGSEDPRLHPLAADIHDASSVAAAVAGAYGVVNAVSLYVERGQETFEAAHVTGARCVAAQAKIAGVARLAHVSGIGADPASPSRYIRKRGEGEVAVRAAFPGAILIRPAVMFGPDDAFLSVMLKFLRRFPAYPLFGRGETQLQPADVDDVAKAIARALQPTAPPGVTTFELGGPQVYSYRELLALIAKDLGRHPRLVPTPFILWRALARVCERLPNPPITTNQVELMESDAIAAGPAAGFATLGITPQPLERVLQRMIREDAA